VTSKKLKRKTKRELAKPLQVLPVAPPPVNFIATSSSFSGPIPPPHILKQYDEAIPGGANRVVEMAEKQSEHRRILEAKVVESDINRSRLGLLAGFIITLVVGGIVVAMNGEPAAGATIAGIPTAGSLVYLSLGVLCGQKNEQKKP
jgi:uncharacterized membrane protein